MIHFAAKFRCQIMELFQTVLWRLILIRIVVKSAHDILTEVIGVCESVEFIFRNAVDVLACEDASREWAPCYKTELVSFEKLSELHFDLMSLKHVVLNLAADRFVQI